MMAFLILSSWPSLAASAKGGTQEPGAEAKVKADDAEGWIARVKEARARGDLEEADRLLLYALEEAEMSYSPLTILQACNGLLEYASARLLTAQGDRVALLAQQTVSSVKDKPLQWNTWINLSGYYLSVYDFPSSREMAYNALFLSESLDDDQSRAYSHLAIGKALEGSNQKIEAFRNYQSAMTISQSLNDRSLIMKCYDYLSRFYNMSKLPAKAIEYKLKEMEWIREQLPVDSMTLAYRMLDLEAISFNAEQKLNIRAMKRIIGYAERHGNEELLNSALALFRSQLIGAGDIATLYSFYHDEHPEYLDALAVQDTLTYLRLRAFFAEHLKDYVEADAYYSRAEVGIRALTNKVMQSHFFMRYAEYLARRERMGEAIEMAGLALAYARSASSLDYALRSFQLLERLSAQGGDYPRAFEYAVSVRELTDSLREIARTEDLLAIEISNAERIREMEEKKEAAEMHRRHNIQYTFIVIAILTLFVVLVMLGSFRVPRWTIQALGFFAFIFLFEFIILIADTEIHHATHGEPWKVMAIKIMLIAILLPLHHWIEKRVVSYLLRRKLVNLQGVSIGRTVAAIWGSIFNHDGDARSHKPRSHENATDDEPLARASDR